MSTFPQTDNHSWFCGTSILEDAIFHRMNWCTFFRGVPCTAVESFYHLGLLSSGTWGSRRISLTLLHSKNLGERFGCVEFARLSISCRTLQVSPLEHCQLAFFANNLIDFFFVHAASPSDSSPRRLFQNFRFWLQNS